MLRRIYDSEKYLFVFISAAQAKDLYYHHNNIKNILHADQDNDHNILYFVPEIASKYDGTKLVDNMAIKDIALAYVTIANCLEVFILHNTNEMNDEFDRQDNKEYVGTILTDADNLMMNDNVSTS